QIPLRSLRQAHTHTHTHTHTDTHTHTHIQTCTHTRTHILLLRSRNIKRVISPLHLLVSRLINLFHIKASRLLLPSPSTTSLHPSIPPSLDPKPSPLLLSSSTRP